MTPGASNNSKHFWSTLFEKFQIATKLANIAAQGSKGQAYRIAGYGDVLIRCHAGSATGDNFMSDTYIVNATSQRGKKYDAFVKVLPSNSGLRLVASNMKIHDREVSMYHGFFKLLEQLRDESGVTAKEIPLDIPESYYVHVDMDDKDQKGTVVVIEELKCQGYTMIDKQTGADPLHVKQALTSLANYHALTITFLRKHLASDGQSIVYPPGSEFLNEKTIYEIIPPEEAYATLKTLPKLMTLLKNEDGATWMQRLYDNIAEVMKPPTVSSLGPLAGIIHGDYWCNNMLFKYVGGQPKAFKMVDFQIARPNHPIFDILYFVYTSCLPETRALHMKDFLNHYYNTLATAMKKLGTDLAAEGYTFQSFYNDYEIISVRGMVQALVVIPFILEDKAKLTKDLDQYDEMVKNDNSDEKNSYGVSKDLEEQVQEMVCENLFSNKEMSRRINALIDEVRGLYPVVHPLRSETRADTIKEGETSTPRESQLSDGVIAELDPTAHNFWKSMFEDHKIVTQLPSMAIRDDGEKFKSSIYGEVILDCKGATVLGDGYMSDTFAIRGQIVGGSSYDTFVKILPVNKLLRQAASFMKVHDREIGMYGFLFQNLQKVREEAGLSANDIPLDVPESYYVHVGEVDDTETVIAIEELKGQGYVMADKMTGLDPHHVKLALSSLAHYHALSIAFLRKHVAADGETWALPSGLQFLNEPSPYEQTPPEMMESFMKNSVDLMRLLGREDNALFIERVTKKMPEFIKRASVSRLGPLACITHGDFWNNNMLFKYNDGMPVSVKMVDFQISRFDHPIYDILYFLYSSTLPETRAMHMADFLTHYFTTVSSSLMKLGVDLLEEGYSMNSFYEEYEKKTGQCMISGLLILPAILEKKNIENLKKKDQEKSSSMEQKATDIMDLADEMKDTMQGPEKILENKMICDRLIKLVDEVKAVYKEVPTMKEPETNGITKELNTPQNFWRYMFEEHKLSANLVKITSSTEGEQKFKNSVYGDVLIKCKQATVLGDGFMSDTFNLHGHTTDGSSYNAFVKVLPSNIPLRQMATAMNVHDREIDIYRNFFQELRKLREETGYSASEIPLDVPEAYYVNMDEVDDNGTVVVIEELKSQGFTMVDKVNGSDIDHVKLALTSLAHYHAHTIAFLRKHLSPDGQSVVFPPGFEYLGQPSVYEKFPSDMLKPYLDCAIGTMKLLKREDNAEWLTQFYERLPQYYAGKVADVASLGPMACFLHGDYWSNNMLFKFADNKPVALKMVDFQIVRLQHPVFDILYYLYSSTRPDLRAKHMPEFLHHYYTTVSSSLKKFGVDLLGEGYTFESFYQDFRMYSGWGMFASLMVTATILDNRNVEEMNSVSEELKHTEKKDKIEEKTELGISKEVEEIFQNLMTPERILESEIVCDRWLKLIDEVKEIYLAGPEQQIKGVKKELEITPKDFWKSMFEEHKLSANLVTITSSAEGEQKFKNSVHGDVLIKCKQATILGDGYMSDTFTLHGHTTDGSSYNAFVKILPSNIPLRQMATAMKIHDREIDVYRNFFQELRKLREETGYSASEIPLDVPEAYYVNMDEVDDNGTVVVIEELKSQGFTMVDKFGGSDFDHVKLALTSLAHYHAHTIAFLRKHLSSDGQSVVFPPGFEYLGQPSAYEMFPAEMITPYLDGCIGTMKLLKREDNAEWLTQFYERLPQYYAGKVADVASLGPMACFLHGDYWNNNMLFKYENNKPAAVKMVDYQIVRLQHPVFELQYFLYSSTLPETRAKHMTEFLQHYFTTTCSSLKKFGVDLLTEGYTFESFYQDFRKYSGWGMIAGLMITAGILDTRGVDMLHSMNEEAKTAGKEGEEEEKNEFGMNKKFEEQFQSAMSPEYIVKNAIVCDRWVKLIDEVKEIFVADSERQQEINDVEKPDKRSKKFWKTLFVEHQLADKLAGMGARAEEGQSFKVSGFGDVLLRCRSATVLGDGFMSDTFAIQAKTEKGIVYDSFAKILPKNSTMRAMATSMTLHDREIEMYGSFFQVLEKLREESGLTAKDVPLDVPEGFYAHIDDTDDTKTVVVIEELKHQGYTMIDKHAGADAHHVKLALTSLANYHALTIALLRKHLAPDGKTVLYPPGAEFMAQPSGFESNTIEMMEPFIKQIENLLERLDRPIEAAWFGGLMEKIGTDMMGQRPYSSLGPMACIIHGDFWSNNMLFKYEGGRPVAVKMVDFQITRMSHALIDVLYFIYSGTLPETRAEFMMEFLQHYFTTVTESLKKLSIDLVQEGYTFDSFYEDYRKIGWQGMVMATMVINVTLNQSVVEEIESSDDPNTERKQIVKGEKQNPGIDPELQEKIEKMVNPDRLIGDKKACDRLVTVIEEAKAIYKE